MINALLSPRKTFIALIVAVVIELILHWVGYDRNEFVWGPIRTIILFFFASWIFALVAEHYRKHPANGPKT